jgi:hypothetical protein
MSEKSLKVAKVGNLSSPPSLDFDPTDRVSFEIWEKKFKSWTYLSDITDRTTIKHILVNCFTNRTMQV